MASKIISITINDEVDDIINDMKNRDMNLSSHIRSLLVFSAGNNFVIPKKEIIRDPNHPDFEDPDYDEENDAI